MLNIEDCGGNAIDPNKHGINIGPMLYTQPFFSIGEPLRRTAASTHSSSTSHSACEVGCACNPVTLLLMRSPWVGSLALLAPAHGFVTQSAAVRGSPAMLQAFVRPSASGGGVRAVSSRAWRWQESLKLQQHQQVQRVSPLQKKSTTVQQGGGVRLMMAKGGGGGGGEKSGNKPAKKKAKKPESYYKQTVILPQTGFEQVGA